MPFVRHRNDPHLGLGIVVRLREGKHDILFETQTHTRTFRPDASVLEPVPDDQVPADHPLRARRQLLLISGAQIVSKSVARKPGVGAKRTAAPAGGSFDDLFERYGRVQGLGFDNEKNLREEREYKDRLSQLAQGLLGPQPLSAALSSGGPTAVHRAASELLGDQDFNFVDKRFGTCRRFTDMAEDHRVRVGEALAALLQATDDAAYDRAFDTFVAHLVDAGVTTDLWPFSTVFSILLSPDRHLLVRPSSVDVAAKALGITTAREARPTARAYRSILQVAARVGEKLVEKGMPAKDMIDIQGFLWVSHREPNPPKPPKAPKVPKGEQPPADASGR